MVWRLVQFLPDPDRPLRLTVTLPVFLQYPAALHPDRLNELQEPVSRRLNELVYHLRLEYSSNNFNKIYS